jgi:hypothetical protein
MKAAVRGAAAVPELAEAVAIPVMHGPGNLLPAFNLGLAMNARGIEGGPELLRYA